jgi:mono/diheme cytochrome c family protein
VWALGDARKWLDRADRVDPRDADTQLMRARCFRQLRDMEHRDEALDRAKEYGASRDWVQREITLGKIQTGESGVEASGQFDPLLEAGCSPQDVYACFVSSAIARDDLKLATVMLDAWDQAFPHHPHVIFHRGVLSAQSGDDAAAREMFEKTLAREPRHDLARLALARMAESRNQIPVAIDLFRPLAAAHPENPIIASGFARALRRAGYLKQAQSVLEPLMSATDLLSNVVAEKTLLETELGNYRAAKEWLDRAAAPSLQDDELLTAATITLSMLGQTIVSDKLVTWMFDRKAAQSLVSDLTVRVAVNPRDAEATSQMRQAMNQLAVWSATEDPYRTALTKATEQLRGETRGEQLYAEHCSACHGSSGNGKGYAARHVFPPPRDLRAEPMRLITTRNGVPTRQDIHTVIKSGIPGTSMVPLDGLTGQEVDLLVDVVLQMRRDGVREQYTARLQAADVLVEEEDVSEVVELQTVPGEVVVPPPLGTADDDTLALGKQLYADQACASCHGDDGTGNPDMPLFDDSGSPAFPRDLAHDVFKGGNQPEAIYLRTMLGMPGTPHPANVTLTTSQLIALTHYCYWLGQEPKRVLTNHQRRMEASRRPAVEW